MLVLEEGGGDLSLGFTLINPFYVFPSSAINKIMTQWGGGGIFSKN